MRTTVTFLILVMISITAFSQKKAVDVEVSSNVELLGFAYFLIYEGIDIETAMMDFGDDIVPKKEWHSYGYNFYLKYKDHAQSESLIKALSVAEHLWIDYIINLLLQVESAPNARITSELSPDSYLKFSVTNDPKEARQNVEIFLTGFNEFYKEVNFDGYLSEAEPYYKKAVEEVNKNLQDGRFINYLERFYNKEFASYNLIPSLTIPKGMGFAMNLDENIYNVFGALDWQSFDDPHHLKMGFDNTQKVRELSVHEFGHSFVNPVIDQLPKEVIIETNHLFEEIKESMANQGYISWKTSLSEHFVRAGEIIIARRYSSKQAAQLEDDYIKNRNFIYLPEILPVLKRYEKGEIKDYATAVALAVDKLKIIKPKSK